MTATPLTIDGSVACDAPGCETWSDTTAVVLADTDPYRSADLPGVFTVRCVCGSPLDVPADRFTRGVGGLDDASASRLGLVRSGDRWRAVRDLDVETAHVRHHGADLVVVIGSGEAQPGRDMVILHGVAEVVERRVEPVERVADGGADRSWPALFVFVVGAAAMLALIGWIHWSAVTGSTTQSELERSGTPATAVVTAARSDSTPREPDRFELDAVFDTGAGSIETTYRVDENTFRAAPVGTTIEVRYDDADPSRSVIVENDAGAIGLAALVVIDALLIALAAGAWWSTRRAARRSDPSTTRLPSALTRSLRRPTPSVRRARRP